MSVIVKGGTVVNSDQSFQSDVYCEDGIIQAIGQDMDAPSGVEVVDAGGCYVMPGGIDPHTHMELPFMETVSSEDFFSGTTAGAVGGTTMIMDFVLPGPQEDVLETYHKWMGWGEKSCLDYSFHIAITWWDQSVHEAMGTLCRDHGVNSFKHFMAFKGSLMADDEVLVNSFTRARELGALCTVHAESGELVDYYQKKIYDSGITGPEGHPQSRPPQVEGEAANRAIRFAQTVDVPIYLVNNSCSHSLNEIARARREGQRVFGEVLSGHLLVDDSVYLNPNFEFAAAHVKSPPFRSRANLESLWRGLQSGDLQITASAHCCFSADQKSIGKDDFRKIPNGTGGIEDRMNVLWTHGVNTGRLTASEFVALTSTNAAKIFNIYPRKGIIAEGSDADLAIFDPKASHTISVKNHQQNVDFNIFEGMELKGVNVATVSNGVLVYKDGDIRTEKGAGRYIDRPCFAPYYSAIEKRSSAIGPTSVDRS